MKLRILILSILSIFSLTGYAQKQANMWYFGNGSCIDFNSNPPSARSEGLISSDEGCASISDFHGNLLFYTDGAAVYNRKHNVMSGTMDLMGHQSSTQSCIIIPSPGSQNIYYIFTVAQHADSNGLRLSIVDMTRQGGLGAVIIKNQPLLTPTVEKLTAVHHANGNDIWVIAHEWNSNAFYSYLVTTFGISPPIISHNGSVHSGNILNTEGYMKVSPNGKRLALAVYGMGIFELFDFDNNTGYVTNPIPFPGFEFAYGIEFSPNSNILYVSSLDTSITINTVAIYQFNLLAGSQAAIRNSIIQMGWVSVRSSLQLTPGFEIFYTDYTRMNGIHHPDSLGLLTGVSPGGRCLTGLPNFIQSYFYPYEILYENTCLGDSTVFEIRDTSKIDSLKWVFGDTASGIHNYSSGTTPKHLYGSIGTYEVTLVAYKGLLGDTFIRSIVIYESPTAYFTLSDSIQCFKGNKYVFSDSSVLNSGPIIYNWNFGDYRVSNLKNPTHTYGMDGFFKVRLVTSTVAGCSDTFIETAYVYPSPIANFLVDDSIQCIVDNSFSFDDKSIIRSGSLNYLWNFGDMDTSTSKGKTIHKYSSWGTHQVKLVVTSDFDCADSFEKTVYIDSIPIVDFDIIDSAQCFLGNNFVFLNNSSVKYGSLKSNWFFGDGASSNIKEPVHSYDTSGTYAVSLHINSDYGCSDSLKKDVFVFPMPEAKFIAPTKICLNDTIYFYDSSIINAPDQISKWHWEFRKGATSPIQNPSYKFNLDGNYTVKLKVTSNNDCTDSINKNITVHPLPHVDLGEDTTITKDIILMLFAGTFIDYLWNDGSKDPKLKVNGLTIDTGEHVYYVTVTDFNGCKNSDTIIITLESTEGIEDYSFNDKIRIYPNPNEGIFNIEFNDLPKQIITVEIININAKIIYEREMQINSNKHIEKLRLYGLRKGIYFVKIISSEALYYRRIVLFD